MVLGGTLNRQHYIRLLRDSMLPWVTGVFERNFVYIQNNTTSHTTRARLLLCHNRMWRSGTGQLGVQTWTPLSMFGAKWGCGFETWMPPSNVPELWHADLQARAAVLPKGWAAWWRACHVVCFPLSLHQEWSHKVLPVQWHGCTHVTKFIK